MDSKKISLSAAFLVFGLAGAQQSQFFSNRNAYKAALAENLYKTKIYSAAQYEFGQQYYFNPMLSRSGREAAQFYDNVIGVILQKNHAEEGLASFIKEYPNSAYFAVANMPLADYYLAQKDFPKALETLGKVNQYQLSREENTQYIMKLGYAKFMSGDSEGAIDALEEAYGSSDEAVRGDVAYMLGHLNYAKGNNAKAFEYFDEVKNQDKYAALVRPYYVQLYYNESDYDRAIAEGNSLLQYDVSEEYKAEVHKIIGESYFMKGEYTAAYPHLKTFLDTRSQPSEKDLYEMGFVAAKMQRYDEAVSYYNRLINSTSPLAQNAYYQLGNAYLQSGKKEEALSAFRSAYQMNYDESVQQLAHLQYAKLSYDVGNPFEGTPTVIQNYIEKYPRSADTGTMNKLLVKSYLYSGNYRETLAAIDRLADSSPETDRIDQEVSFLLGTEEFNKGNLDEAEKFLLRSLEFDLNKEFNNRALYWLAQTYYLKGNYNSAISRYERLLQSQFPEKKQLYYDLGYAYFKNKNFEKAGEYFREYLKNPQNEFRSDAELRLADTYYADNKLDEAIAIYSRTSDASDYTLFQKAMAQGFKGNENDKISTLKTLISRFPASEYADDAEYEIGAAYAAQDNFSASNESFTKVIGSSKDADLVANASIYRAQNYIEQNDDEALAELRTLGSRYRNTAYAAKIVQAARPVFIKKGDSAGYANFAESLGLKVNSVEMDEVNLSAARQFYAKKDYSSAIPLYENYLQKQPTGENLYQAQYELGESYYQTKNNAKALLVLQDVAAVQNDYREEAETRLAQIYLNQNSAADAKKYLLRLAGSSTKSVRSFANTELMKIYAAEQNLSEAARYADLIIADSAVSATVLQSAQAVKARQLMMTGKDREAQAAYTALEKSSNTAVAAEALFAKAYYQNKAKNYKASNETIFRLANNYASEEYWGAKALVLMAKNYIGLKDNYQASYTADQVIANYQDFPDLVAEATAVKKQIK